MSSERSSPGAREAPHDGTQPVPMPGRRPLGAFRVLLVDDEPDVRRGIARLIERLGYQVTATGSGVEALAAIDRELFDVIVTDSNMPGMSGAELIEELVGRRRVSGDRIVVASGDLDADATQALLRRTRARGLPKPFQLRELAAVLGAVTGAAALSA